jgi:hypothetical protein
VLRRTHSGDTINAMPTGIVILICWIAVALYWNISARCVKPTAEKQGTADRLARMPVWLGFVLFLLAWVYPVGPVVLRHTVGSGSIAVVICTLGTCVAIWARKRWVPTGAGTSS